MSFYSNVSLIIPFHKTSRHPPLPTHRCASWSYFRSFFVPPFCLPRFCIAFQCYLESYVYHVASDAVGACSWNPNSFDLGHPPRLPCTFLQAGLRDGTRLAVQFLPGNLIYLFDLDRYKKPICESVLSVPRPDSVTMLRFLQLTVHLLLLRTVVSQQIRDVVSRRILVLLRSD
jgi:hypothetical protein